MKKLNAEQKKTKSYSSQKKWFKINSNLFSKKFKECIQYMSEDGPSSDVSCRLHVFAMLHKCAMATK